MSVLKLNECLLEITRIQHPVGQGCFHSCSIKQNETTYRYIYDCGSVNKNSLKNQIKRYYDSFEEAKELKVDILIFSHYDDDHINGLNELLRYTSVDKMLLPYLNEDDKLLELLINIYNDDSIMLILNPVGYINSKKQKSGVYLVKQNEDRTSKAGYYNEISNYDDNNLTLKFPAGEPSSDGVIIKDSDEINFSNNVLNWFLITHVYGKTPAIVKDIKENIKNKLGEDFLSNLFEKKELSLIQNNKTNLVNCYKDALNKANMKTDDICNRISMSLYSGPGPGQINFNNRKIHIEYFNNRSFCYCWSMFFRYNEDRFPMGWQGTGDGCFKDDAFYGDFLQHYKNYLSENYLEKILTLLIPHHGSKKSFNSKLLSLSHKYAVISAGNNNSYKHPHHSVLIDILKSKSIPVLVTEEATSEFIENIRIIRR